MFEVKAKASVDQFVSIYPTKYVTNAIYALRMQDAPHRWVHVTALLHFIVYAQGKEKYNDVMTIFIWFAIMVRSILQILKKPTDLNIYKQLEPNRQSNRQ